MLYVVPIRVGFVWENQGVCDVSNFIREFRQSLVDCFLQEWHSGIVSRDRLAFYSSFKQSHSLADYLCIIKKAVLRRNFIRFRLGVSSLKVHRLRYTDRSQRIIHDHFVKTLIEQKFISSLYVQNIKRSRKPTCLKSSISVHLRLKWQFY